MVEWGVEGPRVLGLWDVCVKKKERKETKAKHNYEFR